MLLLARTGSVPVAFSLLECTGTIHSSHILFRDHFGEKRPILLARTSTRGAFVELCVREIAEMVKIFQNDGPMCESGLGYVLNRTTWMSRDFTLAPNDGEGVQQFGGDQPETSPFAGKERLGRTGGENSACVGKDAARWQLERNRRFCGDTCRRRSFDDGSRSEGVQRYGLVTLGCGEIDTVRPRTHSDLIPWAQKIEFESCK